jgi:hypothetical protein
VSSSRSSQRRGRNQNLDRGPATHTSVVRTGIALLLVLLGIAWLALYATVGDSAADGSQLAFMRDLGRWNFVIGFGLVFVGLASAAHPSTPMGRGRGVVVGMLGCFLIGLLWIVVYYVAGDRIPFMVSLGAWNFAIGFGAMVAGLVMSMRWR